MTTEQIDPDVPLIDEITNDYWGDESFYAFHNDNLEKWRSNESIIDARTDIGRLHIPDKLIERFQWEAATHKKALQFNLGDLEGLEQTELDRSLTPLLSKLVRICRQQFMHLVNFDLNNLSGPNTLGQGQLEVGQYFPRRKDMWRVDTPGNPYPGYTTDPVGTDITYTMAIGPQNVFSSEHYTRSQLDENGYLEGAPDATTTPTDGVVMVHHGAMAPWSAPDAGSFKQPRLHLVYRVFGAFDQE